MIQSVPLFSLVSIFFTWKSSPYVKKQETKHPHLDFTFNPASETRKYCSGRVSHDGLSHLHYSSHLAIEMETLVDFLPAFY